MSGTGWTRRASRCTCPAAQEHAERLLREGRHLESDDRAVRAAEHPVVITSTPRARPRPVPARCRLHRPRRRSGDRRRVHRPHPAGPALVRRPAPGGRGEGGGAGPAREPDAGQHHLPEPVPHVRQARRHDRHRRHGSVRVQQHLRPGSGGDPDPPPDDRATDRRCGVHSTAPASTRCSEIEGAHERGQPVLVGTTSIEVSELLSST